MEKMLKLTFRQQAIVGLAIFIVNILLAHLFQTGLFHNLGWMIWGGLFLINPVWPEKWLVFDTKTMKRNVRIGAVLCIVIGLITRFGI